MKQKTIILALFGAIASPLAAYAEIPVMDEIVVTATRMPQALSKSIAHTTVLNKQEIRKSAAPDVQTLLRSLAGVEISQRGGLGTLSSTSMRGTNSSQVLVLLDGVRVGSATAGTTALEHIMLDSIERIEVVRGNVSSLYGSEAIGGVIQLFTKQGQGASAMNVSAGLGSHGTQRYSAGFGGEVNDTSFSINAGNVKTNGVSAMNPQLAQGANPNNNGYDNTTLNAQIKHAINAYHILSASAFSSRGNSSFDVTGFGTKPTDLNNAISNISKLSLASNDQLSDNWHSQLRLAQGVDESRSYSAFPSNLQTRSNQITWQNNLIIADKQHLGLSVEQLTQTVSSDANTVYTQSARKVNSFLGGYLGEYGAQQVQLNLRQDRYSDFGTANTGLLGYGVSFADSWRATASISNAFKAPTYNDMYSPAAWGGNPNLKPEHSDNREVGLHYAADGHRVDAIYFDNRIRDLIVYQFPMMINVNKAQITGQELSYSGDFGNKHIKVSATFQNPRDMTTGALLQRRAKQFGSISASHDFNDWNMGAELRYSGARQDFNYNPFPSVAVSLPSYQVFNLTTRYQIDKNMHISARVDNLFNRSYSEVYSYNTLGRTLFVGLTYQQ